MTHTRRHCPYTYPTTSLCILPEVGIPSLFRKTSYTIDSTQSSSTHLRRPHFVHTPLNSSLPFGPSPSRFTSTDPLVFRARRISNINTRIYSFRIFMKNRFNLNMWKPIQLLCLYISINKPMLFRVQYILSHNLYHVRYRHCGTYAG